MAINAVQTTFQERHGIAYPGLVADQIPHNLISMLCETAAGIPFGVAISRGVSDKGAVIGGTDITRFRGITSRDITLIHYDQTKIDRYIPPENMGVLNWGEIWVTPGANVAEGDPVWFNPTTGQLSNAAGAATVGAVAPGTNTGNGALTLAGTPSGGGAIAGTYRVVIIEKVANGGVAMVFDPNGAQKGVAVVGTPFVGPVSFTIADGATDFEVRDSWTIPVTMAALGPIPLARWRDTALSGTIGRVHLAAMH